MQQARSAYSAGAWPEAERLCRWILGAQKRQFDALNLLGIIAAQTGRTANAAEWFGRAVAANPTDATAHNNHGNVLKSLARLDDALASYDRALKINAGVAAIHNNRAVTLQELKRFDTALEGYDRALKLKPDYAEAHNNRGNVLRNLNRFAEALASYERALTLKPDYSEAYNNRGVTLQELKRFDEALDSYDRALRLAPDYAAAHNNRGVTLQKLGRFADALESYERALTIRPDDEWLRGTWLHAQSHICEWSHAASQDSDLKEKIGRGKRTIRPFPLMGLIDSPAVQRRAAEIWAGARYAALQPPACEARDRRAKIRIGYYSADFHDHPTAHLIAELFEKHDRGKFDLVAFSFGPDRRDDMRRRLAASFDRFMDVRMKSDREIAQLSRELQVDIAVDLKGYTQDERGGIFACRAAPVQVNYLGYPGTSGAQHMDYIIADRVLIPEDSRRHFTEKIIYLPDSYQVNDRRRPIADREFSREELCLPPGAFVFCCFNNNYKIRPDVFSGWMRILRQAEGSVLWLLEGNARAVDNLRKEASARGIDAARLIFAPRLPLAAHLARQRAADLFIDTLPYNAHTTASDALWAGLPVLTRMGQSFAARVSASLLTAIGLPELITETQERYEAMAIEFANHPARLAQVRDKLSRNRMATPLFDTDSFTKHIEDAYFQIYERHHSGLAPDHVHVVRSRTSAANAVIAGLNP